MLAWLTLVGAVSPVWARPRCPKGTRAQVQKLGGRARQERCVRRADGVLHGPYRRTKRDGSLAEAGAYADGERTGPWTHRFLLSSDSGRYVAGHKDGPWITALFTGERQEMAYRAGLLHGELRKTDARGKVLERERYADGQPDGAWSGLWPDGRKRFEGSWSAGKRVGTWRWWYEDGGLERELGYLDGLEHGPSRQNWPGGAPWEQGSYDRGERDGPWSATLDDGTMLYRGHWRRGEQVGTWVWPGDDDAAARGAIPQTAAP